MWGLVRRWVTGFSQSPSKVLQPMSRCASTSHPDMFVLRASNRSSERHRIKGCPRLPACCALQGPAVALQHLYQRADTGKGSIRVMRMKNINC